jgi:protein-S-isoprenylcysteine O-methyltransferase Ste14
MIKTILSLKNIKREVVRMGKGILMYSVILVLLVFFLGPYFATNMQWLLSEDALTGLIEARYDYVLLYVVLFSMFALFLLIPFQRDRWQRWNIGYVAFIVALFTEMFGFPLTIFLLSSLFPLPSAGSGPEVFLTVDVPGMQFRLLTTSVIAGAVSIIAGMLIILGWKGIYDNRKRRKLVKGGIYRYMRHPQYTGILMIITAWLLAWPTLPILVMWPLLVYAYYRLARKEENLMLEEFGREYRDYMERVPMFLPGWG